MWAALKSPLLMGNDLRILSAKSLSILNNPAVIAISQDPLGKPPIRISRNLNVAKDKYGMGETQVWSGYLSGGDQVVVFLNAASEDLDISAELEEIFVADGAGGSAPQVHVKWDVYDLWANRMEEATAQKILASPHGTASKTLAEVNWYNSTATPYAQGVKAGDERVIGRKIGSVGANGILSASVKKRSIEIYRLRSQQPMKRYHVRKDEL
jgi:alpha-galactosidase